MKSEPKSQRLFSRRFEELCAKVLTANGHQLSRNVAVSPVFELDLVSTNEDRTIRLAIEAKVVFGSPAPLKTLRDVVSRSQSLLSTYTFEPQKILLILSCETEPEHLKWLVEEFKIQVWDRRAVVAAAAKDPDILRELEVLFRDLRPYDLTSRDVGQVPVAISSDIASKGHYFEEEQEEEQAIVGANLCQELRNLATGKKTAKHYERLLQRIIDYLFGDHLVGAKPQQRLEDRLSYLDVMYRVKPGHPFWDTLTRDFRARVIVFEFKNYTGPIKPNQIYSTERYMLVSALRPVCFIVSRKKPHVHAELAAFGAMREGGKLLVFLTDDDICEMLHVKDVQLRQGRNNPEYLDNDPTVVLDQKVYDFLGRMPR